VRTARLFSLFDKPAEKKMLNRQQQFGKKSEKLAAEFLKRTGYRIVETNYQSTVGEIDIIAKGEGVPWFLLK
jgi:putative endonuclease